MTCRATRSGAPSAQRRDLIVSQLHPVMLGFHNEIN
jgi:hypothetical protein